MLTIFTTPKAFVGHNKITQENAIQSWKRLVPKCEVILLGNDSGTAEAASQFGCKHIADVECSEYGTPLISSLFFEAERSATNPILCYVNSDIMFTNKLIDAVKLVQGMRKFLLVGQRHNVDILGPFDFDNPDWSDELAALSISHGKLDWAWAIDYFIYPRQQWKSIPGFTVGRAGWDNWMIKHARSRLISILDGTEMILALHQNHDYSHCKGGKQEAYSDGPEVKQNHKIIGGAYTLLGIHDAILVLRRGKILVNFERLDNYVYSFRKVFPYLRIPVYFARKFLKFTGLGPLLSNSQRRIGQLWH
jgi:hypothetical protein